MKKASVIPAGVSLEGEIEGDGDLIVLGLVRGPIHIGGALVIEESGQVRGHVRANTVTIRGVLKGDAYGEQAVRVERSARLIGELTAPRVKVVPGAAFRGQIHVGDVGEPRLGNYDPALHTLSGIPAPAPVPELTVPDLAAIPPVHIGPMEDDEDDAPTLSEMRPTIPFIPGAAPVPAQPLADVRPTMPFIPEAEPAEPLADVRPTMPFIPESSPNPKKRVELKMPALGRTKGRRQAGS